jgi:hypothetical protein
MFKWLDKLARGSCIKTRELGINLTEIQAAAA